MKKFKALRIAELFFKTFRTIPIVGIILTLFVFVHIEFSPGSYEKVIINKNGNGWTYNKKNPKAPLTFEEYEKTKNSNIYLSKINRTDRIIFFLRSIFSFTILLLIVNQLVNFILSVKDFTSFHGKNSIYFRKICTYLGVILIFELLFSIKSFTMIFPDRVYTSRFINIDISPFIFIIGGIILSFVISEVFKEGEQLRIENDLTI